MGYLNNIGMVKIKMHDELYLEKLVKLPVYFILFSIKGGNVNHTNLNNTVLSARF